MQFNWEVRSYHECSLEMQAATSHGTTPYCFKKLNKKMQYTGDKTIICNLYVKTYKLDRSALFHWSHSIRGHHGVGVQASLTSLFCFRCLKRENTLTHE